MFLDSVEISVHSGKGGDGMVHFHREKYRPHGGPDGGDGGRGGNVILEVHPTMNTLTKFHLNQRFVAEDGRKGGPNNMTGKSADDVIIPVPPGTMAFDVENNLLGDLLESGQQLIVAKAGRGGRGNQHFASSRNQVPQTAEKGEPGEELVIRLELKLIADVGLVGVPNAGKSSLLASVTNAKPKIANYPFTTLEPNLGVTVLEGDKTIVLADIPGLIEGAHMGVGLGFEFLKHIQRTRVIIHILDGLSEDPLSDYSQINTEMAMFDEKLAEKPQLVALNKMDLPMVQERFAELKPQLGKLGVDLLPISAVTHLNLNDLMWKAYKLLLDTPEPAGTDKLPVYRVSEDPRAFRIERESDGWRVHGVSIERAAAMTFWEHYGSVRRFQKLMNVIGLEEALRNAGISEGENVLINEYVLEWQD
ncbi:MAG: GTPase ObgE [Anaerolineaceae bacterium]|nr:GTPase ObgE [Anaerolineaceae bacterium]